MNLKQIKETIEKQEYDFLKENEHLGNNIILLTLGGSHAYGMDKEDSDLDVRGVALNSKEEILLGKDFEQVVEIYLSDVGRELLNNRKMFLSKICINSFAGYASSQLRRMENKAARLVGQAQN